jgi:hypothetical protein
MSAIQVLVHQRLRDGTDNTIGNTIGAQATWP